MQAVAAGEVELPWTFMARKNVRAVEDCTANLFRRLSGAVLVNLGWMSRLVKWQRPLPTGRL